jgi:histone-binding protein RBBP4
VSDVLSDRIINDEYKVWKKNSPYLYDIVLTTALEWPSLTTQWLPDVKEAGEGKDVREHSLLLGTHTSEGEQNYVMVAAVKLPKPDSEIDARAYVDEKEECGGFGNVKDKVEIRMKIKHEGEVHRLRYQPQNPFVVATRGPSADVHVFDLSKHPSVPDANAQFSPQYRLKGHDQEGYGLSWNPNKAMQLVTAGEDCKICLWDLPAAGAGSAAVDVTPTSTLTGHTATIEDVAWHCTDPFMIGSVGDDRNIMIWDVRALNATQPTHSKADAHAADINSIAFNPAQEFLFATGSSDHDVKLWDLRALAEPVSIFKGHTEDVYTVSWAPFGAGEILASCAADRRVNVWDLSRIGMEQTPEDAEDGPPELLFIHGGHTSKLNDLAWNANDDWVMSSVSDDNVLQVWQMAENIYAEDMDEGDDEGIDEGDLLE